MPDAQQDHVDVPTVTDPPGVRWGATSIIGLVVGLAPIIAGAVQAIQGNDAKGGGIAVGGLLVLIVTLGGRFAQAVALARSYAAVASPWIDALQAALAAPAPGQVIGQPADLNAAPAPVTVNVTNPLGSGVVSAGGGNVGAGGTTWQPSPVATPDEEDDLAASIPEADLPSDDEELDVASDEGLTGRVDTPER